MGVHLYPQNLPPTGVNRWRFRMKKKKEKAAGGNHAANQYQGNQYTNYYSLQQDTVLEFGRALNKAGLSTKDKIIADGNVHRFHVDGDKQGSKNGWYVLFCDGVPAGSFGSWKTGDKFTWCEKSDYKLTTDQYKKNKLCMVEVQKIREMEEKVKHNVAKEKAQFIWKSSLSAPDDYPYLVKKGVGNYGIRFYKGSLVVPMRDSAGNIHSLQFIDGEGNKRFLSGGRKKGCYFSVGNLTEVICIAEGYATAVSIYESTGFSVAVAFDAGNLEPVALALRNKFPDLKIILCADNDTDTEGNPGLTKARQAALAIDALLAVPPCTGDFNDLCTGGTA